MTFTTSSRQVCCLKCSTFKLHMPFHACLYIPTLIKTLSGCYMMRPDTDCALRIYQGQGCVELYGSAHQHASSRLPPHTQPHRHGVMQKETAACLQTRNASSVRVSTEHGSSGQLKTFHPNNHSSKLLHPWYNTLQCTQTGSDWPV